MAAVQVAVQEILAAVGPVFVAIVLTRWTDAHAILAFRVDWTYVVALAAMLDVVKAEAFGPAADLVVLTLLTINDIAYAFPVKALIVISAFRSALAAVEIVVPGIHAPVKTAGEAPPTERSTCSANAFVANALFVLIALPIAGFPQTSAVLAAERTVLGSGCIFAPAILTPGGQAVLGQAPSYITLRRGRAVTGLVAAPAMLCIGFSIYADAVAVLPRFADTAA